MQRNSEAVGVAKHQQYGPHERNYLDVFYPKNGQAGKTVLFFLHGGGFFSGDKGWSDKYWSNIGYWFAERGVIVVAANHRFVPGVTYPGGADDVQLAREWIYNNISDNKFGQGSPNKVVLWGHSSGGAHIAMNLYAAGDSSRPTQDPLFPPVAGVIYFSTPFWYDNKRPIRARTLKQYYGSEEQEAWEHKCALGLLKKIPDSSPLLDSSLVPTYIGIVKWETKEATDAAIAFFNEYRARSKPAGSLPVFHVLDRHNHLSNVLSIGTEDEVQALLVLEFVRSCGAKAGRQDKL